MHMKCHKTVNTETSAGQFEVCSFRKMEKLRKIIYLIEHSRCSLALCRKTRKHYVLWSKAKPNVSKPSNWFFQKWILKYMIIFFTSASALNENLKILRILLSQTTCSHPCKQNLGNYRWKKGICKSRECQNIFSALWFSELLIIF